MHEQILASWNVAQVVHFYSMYASTSTKFHIQKKHRFVEISCVNFSLLAVGTASNHQKINGQPEYTHNSEVLPSVRVCHENIWDIFSEFWPVVRHPRLSIALAS